MSNLANTIRWSLLTNKKQYIRDFLSLYVAYFFLMGVFTGMFSLYSGGFDDVLEGSVRGIILLAWIISTMAAASNICNDLRTKQQLSLYLMLPASNAHKFWARVLISVLQAYVVSLIAMVLADVTQILFSLLVAGDFVSISAGIFNADNIFSFLQSSFNSDNSGALRIFTAWLSFMSIVTWVFSSYILGGIVFRKIPLIMTTIAWILFWTIIITGGTYVVFRFIDDFYSVELVFIYDKDIIMQLITSAIGISFTVLNMWLAFRMFKRYNISHNKWINI